MERHLDTGTKVYEFCDEFLVVCPKCGSPGKVVPDEIEFEKLSRKKADENRNRFFGPRRFVCSRCVHRAKWTGGTVTVGGNRDWYFGFALWLETECCGERLWAYNPEHLGMLEAYVSAKLRERTKKGRNSFFSKLPQWIKSAKNRDEVLKAIRRLKEKYDGSS
jgi:hypothetical protein